MSSRYTCSILFGLLLTQACGKSHSHSDSKPTLQQPPVARGSITDLNLQSVGEDQKLPGVWTSICQDNGTQGSTTRTLLVTPDSMVEAMRLYMDRNCLVPVMGMNLGFQYDARGKQLTTITRLFTATLLKQDYAEAASRVSSCGFNSWSINVEYNLLDIACPKRSEGVDFTGNVTGNRQEFTYGVTEQPGILTLDLFGIKFFRLTPVYDSHDNSEEIFQSAANKENEALLRSKGCETRLMFGLRNCPTPRSLAEAAEMYTLVQRFGLGIWNDDRFKNDKAAQGLLETGYQIELKRIQGYAPYQEAQQALNTATIQAKTRIPQLTIMSMFEVNALDAMKGLKALTALSQQAGFADEIARLKIDRIFFSDSFSYHCDVEDKACYLQWDYNASVDQIWSKIIQLRQD